jgi:hypothetical protein
MKSIHFFSERLQVWAKHSVSFMDYSPSFQSTRPLYFVFCRLYPFFIKPPRQCLAPTCRLSTLYCRLSACLSIWLGEVSWKSNRRRACTSQYLIPRWFLYFLTQRRGRGRGLHPLLRPPGAQPGTSLTSSTTYTPSPSPLAVRYTLCSTLQSRQSTRLFLQ